MDAGNAAGEVRKMHVPRRETVKSSVARHSVKARHFPSRKVILQSAGSKSSFDAIAPRDDAWSFRDDTGPMG